MISNFNLTYEMLINIYTNWWYGGGYCIDVS